MSTALALVGDMTALSIYDTWPIPTRATPCDPERIARRLEPVDPRWRDPQSRLEALKRAYLRATADARGRSFGRAVERLALEVEALEAAAAQDDIESQREGRRVRACLELLRRLGRVLAGDWSWIDIDDRSQLIRWMELEHRLCYAAAKTSRLAFEAATARFGAR